MISAIAVRNYLSLLKERALPPGAVLAESGVTAEQIGDTQHLLETWQYRTIVSNIVKLTGNDGIGLELGTRIDLNSLGAIGHAATTSKTVRDTHTLWSKFGTTLVGIMGRLDLIEQDDISVLLAISNPDPLDPLYQFSVEEMLGLLHMIGKPLVGRAPSILRISLSFPEPRYAAKYRELFKCPALFSAERTTVQVSRAWFDSQIQTYDNEFNSLCLQHCESLYLRFEGTRPTRAALRTVFSLHEYRPLPSLDESAKLLNLTPRTLRRKLQAENTSFREEMDGYREEKAKKLFSYGVVSPKEAAFLLGFKEQSAFRHAFKGWTGQTISEYRGRHIPKDPALTAGH